MNINEKKSCCPAGANLAPALEHLYNPRAAQMARRGVPPATLGDIVVHGQPVRWCPFCGTYQRTAEATKLGPRLMTRAELEELENMAHLGRQAREGRAA